MYILQVQPHCEGACMNPVQRGPSTSRLPHTKRRTWPAGFTPSPRFTASASCRCRKMTSSSSTSLLPRCPAVGGGPGGQRAAGLSVWRGQALHSCGWREGSLGGAPVLQKAAGMRWCTNHK